MNDAHLHLVKPFSYYRNYSWTWNLSGNTLKNNSVKILLTAYLLSAIFCCIEYGWEGAEEMVEDMPNIGH
jgi:hypothetical protein